MQEHPEKRRSELTGRSPIFILGMAILVILGTFAFLALFMLLENFFAG